MLSQIQSYSNIYKKRKYGRSFWLFVSGFLGFFLGILPTILNFVKILFFLFPILVLAYAFSGTKKRFNFIFFVVILFLIMLFNSTFVRALIPLSASDPSPPDITYPELSIDAFNYNATMDTIDTFIGPILFFIILFIPVLAIAGAIWAIIIGQINEAITVIIKVFLALAIMVMFVIILEQFGYSIPGLTDAVTGASDFYVSSLENIYNWAQTLGLPPNNPPNTIGGVSVTHGETGGTAVPGCEGDPNYIPEADMDGNGCLDWWEQFVWNYSHAPVADVFKGHPTVLYYCVSSSIPFLVSGLSFIFGFLFLSKRVREKTDAVLDKTLIVESEPEFEMLHFNYWMGSFVTVIIFFAWIMFLNFARVYQETGIINFTEIGYISIYMIMIVVPVIFLSMPSVTIYTKSTWKSTIKGVVLGVGLLYILLGFVTGTQSTLDAYAIEHENTTLIQVLNTFVFVAPAESMFFHIFILAFALGWMYRSGSRNAKGLTEVAYQEKQEKLQNTIEILTEVKNAFPEGSKEKKWFTAYLNYYQAKKYRSKTSVITKKDFMFRNFNTYILIYIVIILANFLFSISHWIILAGTIDFFVFWLSGLGMIYLISGIAITIIGWRYGWLSAILTHAIYNTIQILTVLLFLGVV